MADLDEAGGQDMEQETADELDCIKFMTLLRLLCLESAIGSAPVRYRG